MKEYYIGLQKDIHLIIDENSFEYQTISENHSRVKIHGYIDEKQMYDLLTINVIENLDKIHKDYNYEIWYKDNRNDVFVRENDNFYYYKFYDNGRRLDFIEGYRDVI